MAHLLHIDTSIQGDQSVSRRLSARAAQRWRDVHPGGTVTYRDLGASPIPHLDSVTGSARMLAEPDLTEAQRESVRLGDELIGEIKDADTILLGLPLYNFGPPSTVKAWVDHIVVLGVTFDPATGDGLFAGRDLVVLAARGGGYGPGTPRAGWDHSQNWLAHGVSMTGLNPRFITAELTLADVNPALAELKPLAAESLAQATAEIDGLWTAGESAA